MIITRIELKNWKNFAQVDVPCGKRVFVIGPNASGKSNFLDALRFLKDVAQLGLERAVNEQRGGLKAIRYINARQDPNIKIAVTLNDEWRYSLTFGSEKGKSAPRVVEEVVEHKGQSILKRPDKEDKKDAVRLTQTALQQVNSNKDFRDVPDFFSSIQYRHILPQLVREPKAFSPTPTSNDPFGRDLVYTIWKTPERTRTSRLKKISNMLGLAVPNLKNLTIKQDENGTPHFEANYKHWRSRGAYQNEAVFSDGTLRLLALLWSLLDTSGPLLLEEPELSLHGEIISQLPSLFAQLDTGKKRATRQVFVTTHSESLLRDEGIGANEIFRLEPSGEGVEVVLATKEEKQAMKVGGLTVADVILPKTRPSNLSQLRLF